MIGDKKKLILQTIPYLQRLPESDKYHPYSFTLVHVFPSPSFNILDTMSGPRPLSLSSLESTCKTTLVYFIPYLDRVVTPVFQFTLTFPEPNLIFCIKIREETESVLRLVTF